MFKNHHYLNSSLWDTILGEYAEALKVKVFIITSLIIEMDEEEIEKYW